MIQDGLVRAADGAGGGHRGRGRLLCRLVATGAGPGAHLRGYPGEYDSLS